MDKLQRVFNYQGADVRVTVINGNPWWVAKDVCEVLDITWSGSKTLDRLSSKHKGVVNFTTPGGTQELWCVDEPGLYKLIMRSNKPEAERFQDWITDEVLPSIRKHGAYLTPEKIEEVLLNPDTIIRLATDLKAEREVRFALEAKIEQDRPKTIFAEAVAASDTSILIGDLAKLLRQNGYQIGQNRLFDYLRDKGYLMKYGASRNMPTQKAMELELFEVKENAITNPDGSIRITKTTKVTGKGQVYFINHFLGANTFYQPYAN